MPAAPPPPPPLPPPPPPLAPLLAPPPPPVAALPIAVVLLDNLERKEIIEFRSDRVLPIPERNFILV